MEVISLDLTNPLRTVAPTVDADVLAVLARNHASMSGLQIQKLAGRSYNRVRSVLERLVEEGVVSVDRHGNTNAYVLNRSHILADAIVALAGASQAVEDRARQLARDLRPRPTVVALFGSFARRDGDAASDIDVLIVRAASTKSDDAAWRRQVDRFVAEIETLAGNAVQIVELSTAEMNQAVTERQPLVASLQRDGVVLVGTAPWLSRPSKTARR
jgi:predicted nucleotidyltransferase